MERTIVNLLRSRVSADPDREAMLARDSETFRRLTWREFEADVLRFAVGLLEIGVRPGDRVLLLSENRPEWLHADLAVQLLGATLVPAHAALSAEQLAFHIKHSGARMVLLSGPHQLAKLQAVADRLPAELVSLSFDACAEALREATVQQFSQHFPEKLSDNERQRIYVHADRHVTPETLATILYTSGTSGEPKGVMLTQGNLAFNAQATPLSTGESRDDLKLAFLPLSHIFARTCDLYIWIACGNRLALAASRESVLEDCAAVHPTWLNGVPYFFDKLRRQIGDTPDAAERLRELLGGQIRSCQCGGAAVSEATYEFFWNCDVPLFPGYGLTESSPVVSVSSTDHVQWGAVGRPLDGVAVRLSDDGEILTSGPHIMQGYWRDEEATRQAIADGWLHTGDLGRWTDAGLLCITGRKKELIVTSTGRNISPSMLETLLVQDPLIDQAFVTGDGREYPVALIVPDIQRLREHLELERKEAIDLAHLAEDPRVLQLLQRRIDALMSRVTDYERIRRFAILPRALSVAEGELTVKVSLRRNRITENWSGLIQSLYERDDAS